VRATSTVNDSEYYLERIERMVYLCVSEERGQHAGGVNVRGSELDFKFSGKTVDRHLYRHLQKRDDQKTVELLFNTIKGSLSLCLSVGFHSSGLV
jgi:hypothetical protein